MIGTGYPLRTTQELTGRIGKYEIVRPLGRGAMGVVYLAHDTVLERDVALKVMVATIADDPVLRERFEREAKAVARMRHPNVVNVYDLGRHDDGSPYIAMELLHGRDLKQTLAEDPSMPLERRLGVIAQALAGLAHAHEAGIVHRDIKPANVFLGHDGTVKLMDFGVARLGNTTMTGHGGGIVGTADYMSPEQVRGGRVDGRSDLFSVGCLLFELACGEPPFHADNLMAIFYRISHEEPAFARLPAGAAYEDLRPILARALAKEPERRYQTAYELAADLAALLQQHAATPAGRRARQDLVRMAAPRKAPVPAAEAPAPVRPRPIRPAPRPAPQAPWRSGWVWVALAGFLSTALGAAVVFWPRPAPVEPPPRIEVSAKPQLGVRPTETPVPPTESPSPSASPSPAARRTRSRQEVVNGLLLRAADELTRNPRKAKALYEQVLALDPRHELALRGHRAASALVAAGAGGGAADPPVDPRTRRFVTRATRALGADRAPARLPGRILFDVTPRVAAVDAPYRVVVSLRNEGQTAIEVVRLNVTTSINDGRVGGAVRPQEPVVPPRETVVLLSMEGNLWRKDAVRWSVEATATTADGATYVGAVDWK